MWRLFSHITIIAVTSFTVSLHLEFDNKPTMACAQSEQHRELTFAAQLAAKLAVPHLEDDGLQSVIANFIWNLTEQNLEVIQASLSYPFSRHQIDQMLTSVVKSATTTVSDLLPKLSEITGVSPSAVVNSTSSSTEDLYQDTSSIPDILKVEKLPFMHPLETFFGITVESLLADCSLLDSLGEFSLQSSELAGIVVEHVFHRVNMVMHNNILKINLASSSCFLYLSPDESCCAIGELLINGVIQKLRYLHHYITPTAAATAIGTVLVSIQDQLPTAHRQSLSVEVTSNVIEYITEDVIRCWLKNPIEGSKIWKSEHVPVLRPTFQSTDCGLLFLLASDQQSCKPEAKTTTLFDSLMTDLCKLKCSNHFTGNSNDSAVSDRLHQRLADLMNCIIRRETLLQVRLTTKEFLRYFVEELVHRLFVSSTFPCPSNQPEKTPLMPFIIKEADSGLTVVDHLTDLVVSQVFELLAKKYPVSEPEPKTRDVSVQEDPPKLTFREKLMNMKTNILKKVSPFKSKKGSKKKEKAEATAESQKPQKKKSLFGLTLFFSVKVNRK
ncbi:uncharacterized protein LOC130220214 [Danio aesculapii]|uniref:uncharacterized protein LOC130220214 n=1 Tax=Danio aesculapii TaxID=1142201 RepID=UPI0024C05FA3|nr:uncharacterized protein LOC130220214 [Danio aesculapii]